MTGVILGLPTRQGDSVFSENRITQPLGESDLNALTSTDSSLNLPVTPPLGGVPEAGGHVCKNPDAILDTSKQLHISRFNSDSVLNPYDVASRNKIYLGLLDAGYKSVGERYNKCGQVLGHMVCDDCGNRHPIPQSCGLVFCPDCRGRRMGKLYSRLKPVFSQMARPQLLTLTVPNSSDVREGFNLLGGAFIKLRRHKCMKFVKGGIYTRETTFNGATGDWNNHIHCLYDGRLSYSAVQKAWKKLTGGVWIHNQSRVNKKAIFEVIGYCGKVPQFPTEHEYVDYFEGSRHMRLTQTFGICFGFVYPDNYEFICPVCRSNFTHYESIFEAGGDGFSPTWYT